VASPPRTMAESAHFGCLVVYLFLTVVIGVVIEAGGFGDRSSTSSRKFPGLSGAK
jgi:hypothetical protein